MTTDFAQPYGFAAKAAVLGDPIAHSLSPVLHQAALLERGLNCSYIAIQVSEEQLQKFVSELDITWVGLSLTMPLKMKILELVPERHELVDLTQSANSVYRSDTGNLSLANTDVFGMESALRQSGLDFVDQVVILGAGATARSAVVAARNLGARSIRVQARNLEQRQGMIDLIQGLNAQASSGEINLAELGQYDVVINTLPKEAFRAMDLRIDTDFEATLLDVIYNPWPSPLATAFPNAHIVSGREMLLWQATRQVELFYGVSAPVDAMRRALEISQ